MDVEIRREDEYIYYYSIEYVKARKKNHVILLNFSEIYIPSYVNKLFTYY